MFSKKSFFLFLFLSAILFSLAPFRDARAFRYERENAVVRAVRMVSPAVVNISSESSVRQNDNPFSGRDPLFDRFFRDFFEPGHERMYHRTSLGSGVIIDGKRGYILTNAHVIASAGKITVKLKDEREFEANIVGADTQSDLAVLKIKSVKTLPAIKMGNSDDLMIGEDVIAIGNPFGFSNTVTKGVISALHRSVRAEDTVYHDFIQTDASINPGNSGGPLLNINGELIGINTAIYSKARGIGFAIPINKAKRIVADLIRYGQVSEIWLGIGVQDITQRMALYLRLPEGGGALVRNVESESPAQKAGIREGDIILSLGGIRVHSTGGFYSAMKGFAPGDRVKLKIWRKGKTLRPVIIAGRFPMEKASGLGYFVFGIKVKDIPSRLGDSGVIITKVRPGSYLFNIGARSGDIIKQIDGTIIKNHKDFEKAVVKYRNKMSVVMLLQRGARGYYITVKLY